MIDPSSGSVGWPSSKWVPQNRPGGVVPSTNETGAIFPRSGWNDGAALSSRAREALNTLNNDHSSVFNWRRPGDTGLSPHLPDMAAMYGLAYPPKDNSGPLPQPPVRPPDMAAMYGLAYPPKDDLGPSPQPPVRPPDMAAMYGLAYPPKDDVGPSPQPPVRPPDMAAMYGLAYPVREGGDGGSSGVRPPDMAAMYGLAYPNS